MRAFASWSAFLINLFDDALRVFELIDSFLELSIEHDPIGDHDDLVEDLAVGRIVQVREAVANPRDGVGLPEPAECWIR